MNWVHSARFSTSERLKPERVKKRELARDIFWSRSMMMVAAPVFSKIVRYLSSELRSSSVRSRTFCSRFSFASLSACRELLMLLTRYWVKRLIIRMSATVM